MSEHESAAINILRDPSYLNENMRPDDPMGRAQALALLAINDHLKAIARSLQKLAKEDWVADSAPEILATIKERGIVTAEEAYSIYERSK